MDLSNRGPQPHNSVPNGQTANSFGPASNHNKTTKSSSDDGKGFKVIQSILMLVAVVVLIGLLAILTFGSSQSNAKSESKYIDSNRLQAVFLNTGQVYFGNIKTLNSSYLVLDNIFYLQTANSGSNSSTSSSASSVSLVKLGCELHAPLDQMVINRSQVTFWENLSPTGQVAKAVNTFLKENPNGQKCSDQSSAGANGQTTPQAATNGSSTPATKP